MRPPLQPHWRRHTSPVVIVTLCQYTARAVRKPSLHLLRTLCARGV